MKKELYPQYLKKMDQIMDGASHLLIVLHTNPDPDAIASASALKYLIGKRYGDQYHLQRQYRPGGKPGNGERTENLPETDRQDKLG